VQLINTSAYRPLAAFKTYEIILKHDTLSGVYVSSFRAHRTQPLANSSGVTQQRCGFTYLLTIYFRPIFSASTNERSSPNLQGL